MRKITIVGGGQSGLQLGLGLLKNGYQVRVVQTNGSLAWSSPVWVATR